MSVPRAVEARRLVGKFVLLVAGVWAMGAVAFIATGLQGSWPPLLNLLVYVAAGVGLVLGAYYSIKLHLTADRSEVDRLLSKAVGYGLAGIAVFAVGFFLIFHFGGSS
ncbi:hypothetical protein ACWT_6409 [Actinoplanes sp. SE50]|uniref:hypothetical protein n=1 Tax=unclassified Actinoplanes TaxID=2626549 RepID=UPI00023EBDF8|nr:MULTISPECIES: hypothetical protein [unclassified Actinoplanes]AEV87422.1 hypothetical protein ACPL_6540 [Actinoplanes sp. SE50/110]ATO85824.1 hypothetical protein ACWT_6409 [Actinoplanes sp. SE50]SLM03237.1 hypothetical protein ACSP50_6526 [Actinoplanes sp. SE50/110]